MAPVATDKLPLGKLLAFTLVGFLAIVTDTMPAGLLPQISAGLGVSEAIAGQLVTLFALGAGLGAIPLIAVTRGWRRRPLFLLAIAGLLVFNAVTAVTDSYALTLAARFVAGMATGLVWGLLVGYARRMVAPHLQGRALAIAVVGQPVALSVGVPLGSWLGHLIAWQGVFWLMAAVALVLFVWVRLGVPDYPGQAARERLPLTRVLLMPGIRPVLVALLAWILAHNILYTYIAPFLASAGLASWLEVMLALFGVAAFAGLWLTGLLVDRMLRALTLLSLAGFTLAALMLGTASGSVVLMMFGVTTWGLTFGGAPTLLQTALADTAGDHADAAQSMLVTVFNTSVAGGGIIGGLLLEHAGAASLPWALGALALSGLLVTWSAREHGFRPGQRVVTG